MKRRTFAKTSSLAITGSMLAPMVSCSETEARKNWAGNYEYSTHQLHQPKNVEQVQDLVKKKKKLKSLGTRHSFNGIADSNKNQISSQHLDQVVVLDRDNLKVTVDAGIRYGELGQYLHGQGFALHNLASLPHISVAGACATGTHGSGDRNGNLSTAVSGMELVTAEGELVELSLEKDGEKFNGSVVHLGGIGVITKVILDIQPTYMVRQDVYQYLPMEQLEKHFSEIVSRGHSVSFFTDWQDQNISQVWIKSQLEEGVAFEAAPELFGAKLATRDLHPIEAISAENCTEQMGVAGPWHERLPHFRLDFTPSSGEELQSEYFVPRQHAVEAIQTIFQLSDRLLPHLFISEIRTIAADQFWMSPCYKQPCVAIHFTWKPDWPAVSKLLPVIEAELAPFEVRPHWGKLFTLSPSLLQSRYSKLGDFQQLLRDYDPKGKFRNQFLDTHIFGT